VHAADNAGVDELLRYVRAVYETGERVSEAKLVLVGEGEVGKSSLLGALIGEPFVDGRDTTHGIEIKPLAVTHEGVDILLNCWDFGGQPVYRPTHQLFFTKPAVYLVVWKPREGPELGQVEYWLSLIKDRAGAGAKVHVVATHGGPGQRPAQLDRAKLLERFGNAAAGGMVAGFHHVDSETGTGIEELRKAIAKTAGSLPHVTRWYPGNWLKVRKALAKTDEAYLRYADYWKVAKEHGLSETSARSLAKNAHALGQVIYYDDDPALQDLVVFKADWLSVAIGFVLEDRDTENAGGLLPHRRLPQIWADPARDSQHRYSHELQQMFLRLMERFDLTYRAPELANEPLSLVAQLLPSEPPAHVAEEWDGYRPGANEVMQVCQFVEQDTGRNIEPPTGLMARLIVLFHRHSLGRKDISRSVHWQNGLVLEDRYGARALLSMDSHGLTVRVKGVNPDAFLSHLVHETRDYVEGFWVGRRTKVLVPCPESCGATAAQRGRFDLDRLYKRLHAGKSTAECHSAVCENDVEIADLLAPFGGRGLRDADEQARVVVREAVSGELVRQVGPMLRAQTEQILHGQRMGVEEIKNGLWEIGDQLDEKSRIMFSQLDGRLAVILRALDDEANDGPRLFQLEPVEGSLRHPDVTKFRMRLTLWCEHSKLPLHLLEPHKKDAGVYTVAVTRDWWVKAAPVLKATATLLKALLPLGLPVIKADLDDAQWKAVEERYTLGKESLGAAATLGADIDDANTPEFDATGQPILAEGGLLRTLHAELRKQDITYADLRKVRGEGHRVFWVHPRFEHIYNPAPPRIPT
jgi:hypothetical protein